ncbi:Aste57867_14247 [Aphanomyces stellatus]|uniref:Aste57867_14247 protein n=1 Tax=Aphanomyces stellatus TaxID=120398 RepID=A0A485L111_9STRA|nr:hypothetical protein As57867_014196 [Aphanomyces stellatus]VFT91072.1 Aste57867_14247 [Aphanomyces stellatus]
MWIRSCLAVLLACHIAHSCTLIAVGRNATADGSTFVAQTDDAGSDARDVRVVRVPAMVHPAGSQRAILGIPQNGFPRYVTRDRGPAYMPPDDSNNLTAWTPALGAIPEVNATFAYWESHYGMQNERQLGIAESSCGAKTVGWPSSLPFGHNLLNTMQLTQIALERCDTAVCAIQTMGALAEQHGFYGATNMDEHAPPYTSSGDALAITDRLGNVWLFHILTGPRNASAIWAAMRVPDTHVAVVPNTFVIRGLNLSDPANYLASANVVSFAIAQGWSDPAAPFDFTAAYGYCPPADTLPGVVKPLYGGRRLWRVFDWVAPSLALDPTLGFHTRVATYPVSVQPDAPLAAQTLVDIFQDHYEGTPFDLTQGVAAGPYHDPARFTAKSVEVYGHWERPISIHRCAYAVIVQARSWLADATGGVVWYGHGEPANTVFFPIACGQDAVAPVFTAGLRSVFDTTSTFWAFHFTQNWAHLRYDAIHGGEIRPRRDAYQQQAFALQRTTDTACSATEKNSTVACVAHHYDALMTNVTAAWWQFAWTLVPKYCDGAVLFAEGFNQSAPPYYPSEWLNQTEYVRYPRLYSPSPEALAQSAFASAVASDNPVPGTLTHEADAVAPFVVPGPMVLAASTETHGLSEGFLLGVVVGLVASLVIGLVAAIGFQTRRMPLDDECRRPA